MKNITTLEDLKKKAFDIPKPIQVMYPTNYKDFFDPQKENYKNHTFNVENKKVIAFFTENILYVIPFTYKAIEILEKSNFAIEEDMYVPFVDYDYPIFLKKKWDILLREAQEQHSEELIYEVIEYCDQANIGSIDDSLLEKCLEIPEEGLIVQFSDSNSTTYPVSPKRWGNFVKQLGHYNYNNGTHVFVYRNGKTYVTRCYDVILALRNVGYQPNFDMYVPLSNGESIVQTKYSKMWEKVKAS